MKAPNAIQLSVEPALQGAITLLGDRLTVRLVLALEGADLRFGQLQGVGKASSKTVSARLKDMERHGLVTRTLYAEVPPRVVYALTPKGRELVSIVLGLAEWEQAWAQR